MSPDLTDTGHAQPAPPEPWTGVVIRPPNLTWDGRVYSSAKVLRVDDSALAADALGALCFRFGDFVGVVASTRVAAVRASRKVLVAWSSDSTPSVMVTPPAARTTSYHWPAYDADVELDAPARAEAHWRGDSLFLRLNVDDPAACASAIGTLFGIPPQQIDIFPNGLRPSPVAHDLAADTAVLARASGRCIRMDATASEMPAFTRHVKVETSLTTSSAGSVASLQMRASEPPYARPLLAELLVGASRAVSPRSHGDEGYAFPMSWQVPAGTPVAAVPCSAGASAAAHVFARESALDEWAAEHGVDPVALRLRTISSPAGARLVQEVAERSAWCQALSAGPAHHGTGRGFAYACSLDAFSEPPRRSWSAWVVDVAVDSATGGVNITRLVVGHHVESLHLPEDTGGARLQARVQDACKALLAPPASFDDEPDTAPAARLPGSVELVTTPGENLAVQRETPSDLSEGPALTVPAAAALANAIFSATGVRLRQPPFGGVALQRELQTRAAPRTRQRGPALWLGGVAAAAASLVVAVLPWRSSIPLLDAPVDLSVYSVSAIERGRRVAAAGDCMVCHTAPGGTTNAGGLGLDTPFGTVYSTNITPDTATGIGGWSYGAFERAMRQGIHRDGRHLYPAFPYTAFAKLSDGDVQGLYAYLMTQPAVVAHAPQTRLAFPYNVRPLLAGWNALFHDSATYQPDPRQTVEWNRGAYLVQGAGHCGACHTPRNALGAEKSSRAAFLAGGEAEHWEAPALNGRSNSPLPWTQDDFYQYLRFGYAANHGVAAGPMGPVVASLAVLPDSDIHAIALYLGSLAPTPVAAGQPTRPPASDQAELTRRLLPGNGEKIFTGACAACHDTASGPTLFGVRPSLELNSNLHSARPDNLIQIILRGIETPAYDALGAMPGFADNLSDGQIADLAAYMRGRFAPDKPAWPDSAQQVRRLRATHQERPHVD